MLAGGFAWFVGWRNSHDTKVVIYSALFGLVGMFVIQFLIKLLAAPVKMEKEASEKAARTEKVFADVDERNAIAHKEHLTLLENRIETLKKQLNDRAKKLEIEGSLGIYHTMLTNRVREIRDLGIYSYNKKYEESCQKGNIDPDTMSLINEVDVFLFSNIKGASKAIFWDRTKIVLTPVSNSNPYSWEERHWYAVMDTLKHHAIQLMKIIDKYTDSKGDKSRKEEVV